MACLAVCLFVLLNVVVCSSIEPLIGAGALALFISVGNMLNAWIGKETCSDKWIDLNVDGLRSDIQENVFGQHLMESIVLQTLNAHTKTNPRKALVLSFHGPQGTGKNLVTSYIAKNLFKEGSKSHYVHLYIGTKDLYNINLKTQYMEKLRYDVESATRQCGRNLFVFDEVDKMVPGVLDALSPFIDFHDHLKGVDYRKNIFVFLSNAGANDMTKVALKSLEAGKKREDITLKEFEHAASRGAFHEIGGLQNSEIVKRGRIDIYVPFLPLEKKHVKNCIKAELKINKWMASEDMINQIADDLEYIPGDKDIFSRDGCKKVHQRVKRFYDDFLF